MQRALARFDVPDDVLDHHDGVVDDEADGDGDSHQRQVVDAVAQKTHHPERAGDRQGNRRGRDQRRPHAAQEQEHHQHDQCDGEQQRALNVAQARTDRLRSVVDHLRRHRGRQSRFEFRQHAANLVHGVDDVEARLLVNVDNDRAVALNPRGLLHVLNAVHSSADITHAHRCAVAIGQHEVVVVGGLDQLIGGVHRHRALRAVERSFGRVRGG